MQLRATPESRRVAIWTAIGAATIAVLAAVLALSTVRDGWIGWFAVTAAIATLIPAVGAITARVTADDQAIAVHRFGRTRTFSWQSITGIGIVERRANLPDGTEYHWFAVQRAPHRVAVPCLELTGGPVQELPMLASRALGPLPRAADQNVEQLARARPPHANP